MSTGLAASVQVRLVRHAHALNLDPNLVLARYAAERLLYRLSRSPYADRFVLKGALMLLVWLGEAIRPTRDADLLGFGDINVETLLQIFTDLCRMKVEPDGLEFDTSSLRVAPIRVEDAYGGQRATLIALLGSARLKVQVDVGIGDAVFPEPGWIEYPTLSWICQNRDCGPIDRRLPSPKNCTQWWNWVPRTVVCATSSISRPLLQRNHSKGPCSAARSPKPSDGVKPPFLAIRQ